MGVSLPAISGGSVLPEYAATSINFNRGVQKKDGEVVAVFTAHISYQRWDYLLDAEGNRVAIVNSDLGPGPQDPNRYGSISLTPEQTAEQFAIVPLAGQVIGQSIADMADALIKQDLIKRGILPDTTN